jgi:hypothetical protein
MLSQAGLKPKTGSFARAGLGSISCPEANRNDLTGERGCMSDMLFIAIGLGFFAASCLYLFACDRL